MFSLVIAIIAIALVVALVVFGGYYGGSAVNEASDRAEAARLKNEEQQILAGVESFKADQGRWPTDVLELVSRGYLTSAPRGARQAHAPNFALISTAYASDGSALGWHSVVPGQPIFLSNDTVTMGVCRQYNLASRGDDGILRKAYNDLRAQCYGVEGSYKVVFFRPAPGVLLGDALEEDVLEGGLPAPSGGTAWWAVPPSGPVKAPIDPDKTPIPLLTVSPSTLDFVDVAVGTSSAPLRLALRNGGNAPLDALTLPELPAEVTMAASSCSTTLAVDEECEIRLSFTPSGPGPFERTLQYVGSNTQMASLVLRGRGAQGSFACSGPSCELAFGQVQVGERLVLGPVTLRNAGLAALTGIQLVSPEGFAIEASTCSSTLEPAATCQFSVGFVPGAAQNYPGVVTARADQGAALDVPLSAAQGVEPQLTLVAGVGGVTGDFNVTLPSHSSSGVLQHYRNTGKGPVTIESFTATGYSAGFGPTFAQDSPAYCWSGRVLEPGDECQTFLFSDVSTTGAGTLVSSAGELTVRGSMTVTPLTVLGASAGITVVPGAGVSEPVYTVTLKNQTDFFFHFPRRAAGGSLSTIGRFSGPDANRFVVSSTSCGVSLAPKSECTVALSLTGTTEYRAHSAQFEVNGGFQQAWPGSQGQWSAPDWFVACGNTPCDVYGRGNVQSVSAAAGAWLVNDGAARRWSDNTYAASCVNYQRPSTPKYSYSGATGSGVYRIQPAGSGALDVYCDMTTLDGGWTLILSGVPGQDSVLTATPLPMTATYIATASAQAIARGAAQVLIRDQVNPSYFTYSKTTLPIERMRQGLILNNMTTGTASVDWDVAYLPPGASMDVTCPLSDIANAAAYPQIYWACGNNSGLHLSNGGSTWIYSAGLKASAIGVWVR